MSTTEEPRTLTVEQARKLAGVGRQLAYEMVRTGQWPSQRWGDAIRIPKQRFFREVLQEEEPS